MEISEKKPFDLSTVDFKCHRSFLAIFIPIQYVEYYNQNKVVPFETETKDVDVTHGSLSSLPDFNLLVTCTDYIDKKDTEDKQNQSSAKFRVSAYKNDQSDEKKSATSKSN